MLPVEMSLRFPARLDRLWRWPLAILHRLQDGLLPSIVLRATGVDCGSGLCCHGIPWVTRHPKATIVLGKGVRLDSRSTDNVLYLARPCRLAAMRAGARIRIGDCVAMSGATLVAADSIEIGERTMIGAEVMIIDTDFHPLNPERRAEQPTQGANTDPVCIGRDVFIGTRAIILRGVTIGDGAVIGAGAVVTHSVSERSICAGNPAREVGTV